MAEREYEELRPITRDEAIPLLREANPKVVPEVLFRLALHEPDWTWVRGQCLDHLDSDDAFVRYAAAECLCDLSRARPDTSWWALVPRIRKHLQDSDSSVVNGIQGTLEFIDRSSPPKG